MQSFMVAYFAAAIMLMLLESAWLSQTAGPLYRRALGAVMAEKARLPAAAAFYVIYVLGVVIFAVQPGLASGDWHSGVVRGALFGFFAYATYDLTNLATLKVWSLKVSLIDMMWGAFLTGASSGFSVLITSMMVK